MNSAASKTRIVWLVFERVPHPDAVSYPADIEDVRLVLSLLDYRLVQRSDLVRKLRRILDVVGREPPCERPTIPARMPNGLYRPISWRLAKWLACVLGCEGSPRERLMARLRTWVDSGGTDGACNEGVSSISGVA